MILRCIKQTIWGLRFPKKANEFKVLRKLENQNVFLN